MSYKDYLTSEHWKEIKERYWNSKLPNSCYCCGKKHNLQLHHKTYKRLGKEKLTDLIYLCDNCHEAIHLYLKNNNSNKTTLWNVARKVKKKINSLKRKKHNNKDIYRILTLTQHHKTNDSKQCCVCKRYFKSNIELKNIEDNLLCHDCYMETVRFSKIKRKPIDRAFEQYYKKIKSIRVRECNGQCVY